MSSLQPWAQNLSENFIYRLENQHISETPPPVPHSLKILVLIYISSKRYSFWLLNHPVHLRNPLASYWDRPCNRTFACHSSSMFSCFPWLLLPGPMQYVLTHWTKSRRLLTDSITSVKSLSKLVSELITSPSHNSTHSFITSLLSFYLDLQTACVHQSQSQNTSRLSRSPGITLAGTMHSSRCWPSTRDRTSSLQLSPSLHKQGWCKVLPWCILPWFYKAIVPRLCPLLKMIFRMTMEPS